MMTYEDAEALSMYVDDEFPPSDEDRQWLFSVTLDEDERAIEEAWSWYLEASYVDPMERE